jgi:hypothetical protein
MTERTEATAAEKPRRKVTLREMIERLEAEARRYREHQDMMVRLVKEEGPPWGENPEEYAIAEAFESAARTIAWILRSDDLLTRLKNDVERGGV